MCNSCSLCDTSNINNPLPCPFHRARQRTEYPPAHPALLVTIAMMTMALSVVTVMVVTVMMVTLMVVAAIAIAAMAGAVVVSGGAPRNTAISTAMAGSGGVCRLLLATRRLLRPSGGRRYNSETSTP